MFTKWRCGWVLCLLFLGLGGLFAPPGLGAQVSQDCRLAWDDPDCPPDLPPNVSVSPSGGTYTQADLDVVIYLSDDYRLDTGSFDVILSGATVVNPWRHSYNPAYTSDRATNTIQLQPGTNTLSATVCDDAHPNPHCTTQTATYTYDPPPPLPEKGAPGVSLAPHSGDIRGPSLFAAVSAYTTPAYVSLDVPRSVTLLYSSEQASPTGFVQVDADANSATAPEKMSIFVRNASGRRVRFANGRTETFYIAGPDITRLAAQWDASDLPTGAYDYTVVVRNWWGTEYRESTQPVRVLIVNEQDSPFGAGWSAAGLQRLHAQSDSSVVLTAGDGSALYFAKTDTGYAAPAGDFTRLTRDGTEYTRKFPDGARAVFTSDGRLQYVEDRFGNRTTYGYDGAGRLASVTDPVGESITLVYDAVDRLASIRDPTGRTASVAVDRTGRLTRITDPDGIPALRAHYDGAGRMMTQWDRSGSGWGFTYDAAGRLAVSTAPAVLVEGTPVRPLTRFRSWAATLLPRPGSGGFLNPARRVTPESARAEITDPKGNTTRMALDRFALPTRIEEENALGTVRVSTFTRDEHGRLTRVTTPEGGSTSYTYSWDRHNPHPTRITRNNTGASVELVYELTYYQLEIVRGDAPFTRYYYGGPALLPDSVRVDTSTTHYTHDARGRPLSVTDPEGHRTTLAYRPDGTRNTLSVTRAGGAGDGTITYGYDALGRVDRVTDPAGRVFTTAYDALNRVTSTTAPESTVVRYGYDDRARTYTVTDPKDQLYTTRVNALGWTESLTDPRGQVERFAYDRNGNVLTYTNRRGQRVEFTYDALGRVLARLADGKTTTFAYDTAGLWMAAWNEESTDTLHTDAAGRLSRAVAVRNGQRYALTPTYTPAGLRNALTVRGPWGTRSPRLCI